jgi:hypothetical protein
MRSSPEISILKGHGFTACGRHSLNGHGFTSCEKTPFFEFERVRLYSFRKNPFFERAQLQLCHRSHGMIPALAAEGLFLDRETDFPASASRLSQSRTLCALPLPTTAPSAANFPALPPSPALELCYTGCIAKHSLHQPPRITLQFSPRPEQD